MVALACLMTVTSAVASDVGYDEEFDDENCLQKDLVYELGISKASVTRILDKLSDKNIVERVSYGKTNKVRAK